MHISKLQSITISKFHPGATQGGFLFTNGLISGGASLTNIIMMHLFMLLNQIKLKQQGTLFRSYIQLFQ